MEPSADTFLARARADWPKINTSKRQEAVTAACSVISSVMVNQLRHPGSREVDTPDNVLEFIHHHAAWTGTVNRLLILYLRLRSFGKNSSGGTWSTEVGSASSLPQS
jgi:hypothetical protein